MRSSGRQNGYAVLARLSLVVGCYKNGVMLDFNLPKEEYLTLRHEIETQMTELGQLERNCVVAAAIVYAWLVKDGAATSVAKTGWFLPIFFALFGALRSLSVGRHLFTLGRYIHQIESAYLTDPNFPKGWEHFLAAPEQKRHVRTAISILFWVVFLVITIVAAVIYGS